LRSKGEVVVLNIGEGRAVANKQYLPVTGAWAYLRKVFRLARTGRDHQLAPMADRRPLQSVKIS
jgi:hypothetical protein